MPTPHPPPRRGGKRKKYNERENSRERTRREEIKVYAKKKKISTYIYCRRVIYVCLIVKKRLCFKRIYSKEYIKIELR